MAGELEGRTALVTGGGRGIGRAICLAFAQSGARVAVADIDTDSASSTVDDLPTEGMALEMDVASPAACKEGVRKALDEFGQLDILVNNAGLLYHRTVDDCTEEDWDRMIDVSLKGTFFCSQAAIPHMRERRRGCILTLTSLAAKNGGLAAAAPYAAAKGGIYTLTIYLARAMAPFGVRANGIAPGVIDTDMTRSLSSDHADLAKTIPLGQKGEPEDVANCALFLASDRAKHITGEIVDVNGGLWMD